MYTYFEKPIDVGREEDIAHQLFLGAKTSDNRLDVLRGPCYVVGKEAFLDMYSMANDELKKEYALQLCLQY